MPNIVKSKSYLGDNKKNLHLVNLAFQSKQDFDFLIHSQIIAHNGKNYNKISLFERKKIDLGNAQFQ